VGTKLDFKPVISPSLPKTLSSFPGTLLHSVHRQAQKLASKDIVYSRRIVSARFQRPMHFQVPSYKTTKVVLKEMFLITKRFAARVLQACVLVLEDTLLFFGYRRRKRGLTLNLLTIPELQAVEKVKIPSAIAGNGKPGLLNALYQPAKPGMPTVIYSNGRNGSMNKITNFTGMLDQGMGLLLYEYPGFGSTQGKPTEETLYKALKDVRQFLADQGVPHHEQILYGYSMGGAVSVDSAAKQAPKALILESTMTSLPEAIQKRLGKRVSQYVPLHRAAISQFRSEEKLKQTNFPLMLLHGNRDPIMPIEFAERLFEAAKQSGNREIHILQGGHSINKSLTQPHVERFLKQFSSEPEPCV